MFTGGLIFNAGVCLLLVKMAEGKCDGLSTVIKEQGDLIRSLKLNSAPKEQVTDTLHANVFLYKRYARFTYM